MYCMNCKKKADNCIKSHSLNLSWFIHVKWIKCCITSIRELHRWKIEGRIDLMTFNNFFITFVGYNRICKSIPGKFIAWTFQSWICVLINDRKISPYISDLMYLEVNEWKIVVYTSMNNSGSSVEVLWSLKILRHGLNSYNEWILHCLVNRLLNSDKKIVYCIFLVVSFIFNWEEI